jgi:hypothetical protein
VSDESPELESGAKGREIIGALQGQQIDRTLRRFKNRTFGVDEKGEYGGAVPILRQKGSELEDDTFSAAKSPGELIEHEQDVG